MKTKNKLLALVEIVLVLCSLFLVALPATTVAAEQDDYVLGVYGNANEDDTIDMRDLTYVKLIFFGKKPETELADAKYDGKINPLDFIQIKLIIVGKEKELTIVDSADRIVTVKEPIERAVIFGVVEVMRSIKATDKIVGVDKYTINNPVFFSEFSNYPNVGAFEGGTPDIEQILLLHPDIVLVPAWHYSDERVKKFIDVLPASITAIRINCHESENYVEEMKKLGYIFDRREEAIEYIDFYEECMDTIKSTVETISEEERPGFYLEAYRPYKTIASGGYSDDLKSAGGHNIFSDFSGWPEVDPESVVTRNPNIIVRLEWANTGYDTDDVTEVRDIRNAIMNRPELANVDAVKAERVYIISEAFLFGEPFIALGYMAKWFHPTLFDDLNPKTIHQEYLTRFQGLDYDLDKHGVFVYPPLEG